MKSAGIIIVSLLVHFMVVAQSGYKITVRTGGAYTDTVCYLGYYYGKYQYAKDTAQFDKKGVAVFSKPKKLDKGLYFVVFPDKKYFEFVINQEQVMTFDVDTSDIIGKLKVTGSKENQLFFEYNKQIAQLGRQYEALKKEFDSLEAAASPKARIVEQELQQVSENILQAKKDFIAKNPQTLVAQMFRLTIEPELPPAPLKEDGTVDSLFLYYAYRNHYWDHMDFNNDALLRSPVFHQMLERYLSRVIPQHPDSIIVEVDKLIARAEQTPELFKYIVWFTTFYYETSQIMGFDAVFVHLVDKYYKTGKAFWASESTLKKIIERADKIRPTLIGQIAQNMALIDTTLKSYIPLYSIQAKYLIMIFWDPNCGHCKKEIEQLKEFYDAHSSEFGVKVYSVCTDTSLTNWKKKIQEKQIEYWINVNGTRSALGNYQQLYDIYSTPVIYILNEEKKIIAKRIPARAIHDFLVRYEKSLKQ